MLMSFLAKLLMLLLLLASRYPSFTSLPSSSDWSERPVGSFEVVPGVTVRVELSVTTAIGTSSTRRVVLTAPDPVPHAEEEDSLPSQDLALNLSVDSIFSVDSGVFDGVGSVPPPGKTDPEE